MLVSNCRLVVCSAVAAGIAALACVTAIPHTVAAAGDGVVRIHQMGGDINVPTAPDGAELATMGGNIHVGSASFVNAKTMGGDIVIQHASAAVDASTMGGKITIDQVSGAIHASTMGGDVTAHLTGASTDAREVKLTSLAGTILLTVPKDFGMDVHIKLAYTHGHEDVAIRQHLGLAERQTTEWESHNGSPRKYIYATGRVGDGRNHVTIETINGDVILKQE